MVLKIGFRNYNMPYERRPREMHKATCGDCGNECEIPFEPRNDRPVYCSDCFKNHRQN